MKTKSVLLFLVLMIAFHFGVQSQSTVPVSVKVIFPFDVEDVSYRVVWPEEYLIMEETGTSEYSIEFSRNVDEPLDLWFNIRYSLPEYNSMILWLTGITGGTPFGDPMGIIYGKLYVNNIMLNNSFIAKRHGEWANFYLTVNPDNTIKPFHENNFHPVLIDDRIPAEVAWRKRYSRQYPSPEYNHINGWMQVITDNNILNPSKVEVDYLRLYGRADNSYVMLKEDTFNIFDTVHHGGLYLRYPFFPPGFDEHDPMPATVSDGILTFYPSDNRTKVWHWWNSEQTYLPNIYDYDSYRIECKIRITGHALAQGGIDFIKHFPGGSPPPIHYELGVSDWYFENNGEWQIVVFDSDPNAVQANQLIQNKTISDGEGQCFDATHTITVKDFYVMNGGTATLIAGENILIQPVTEIESGAHLNAYITQEHSYCLQPESILESLNHFASTELFFPPKNVGSCLSLFPNPTTGSFTLELLKADDAPIISVSIFSMIGEMLLKTELPSQNLYELNLSNHPKGIYIIRVIAGEEMAVGKLIKQ